MVSVKVNILKFKSELPATTKLVAVSKFQPNEVIMEAYSAGHRLFGESRPQELLAKVPSLPSDIEWHFIGTLQSNKLKMVLPYATLIHSVDSERLLTQIENYSLRNNLKVQVLLQVHIAQEETKQGFTPESLLELINKFRSEHPSSVTIRGLMGMATFTDDESLIREEFSLLTSLFEKIRLMNIPYLDSFDQLSFGMSDDYHIAVEMGSTLVRIGTSIFGHRS